jgi:DNA repair exonuclease SbcCD ATPase subunit
MKNPSFKFSNMKLKLSESFITIPINQKSTIMATSHYKLELRELTQFLESLEKKQKELDEIISYCREENPDVENNVPFNESCLAAMNSLKQTQENIIDAIDNLKKIK